MAKQRDGPRIAGQLLYYPVTDASFDTASYHQFATGYWLRRVISSLLSAVFYV